LELIGYPFGHSFPKTFYLQKFERERIMDVDYDLFPMEDISGFSQVYERDRAFDGYNVTIPHKRNVLRILNEFSPEAAEINAVNCIQVRWKGDRPYLKGFNTDAFGFEQSLAPLLKPQHRSALVFGNGGAAQAVFYVLRKLGIAFEVVSRSSNNGDLT